jgi:DNA-binding FadR family transcriptional regulator
MRDWRMIDEDVVNWRFRAKPDPVFMRDVIEFRMLIEPRAAAQAASRASVAEVAAIREAFDVFKGLAPEDPGYANANEALHTRIVHASGNQFFQQMAAIIRGALQATQPMLAQKPGVWEISVQTNEKLVSAIERRDPKEAEAAALALIELAADEVSREFSVDMPGRH